MQHLNDSIQRLNNEVGQLKKKSKFQEMLLMIIIGILIINLLVRFFIKSDQSNPIPTSSTELNDQNTKPSIPKQALKREPQTSKQVLKTNPTAEEKDNNIGYEEQQVRTAGNDENAWNQDTSGKAQSIAEPTGRTKARTKSQKN